MGPDAYPRNADGSTPSTASCVPLIRTLAASIGSALVTPGCRATAVRTWPDSENGATTSRSAWRSPRSGATFGGGSGEADRVLAAGAAGTARSASAPAPSSGTTGLALAAERALPLSWHRGRLGAGG